MISALATRMRDGPLLVLSTIIGACAAAVAREWLRSRKKQSPAYIGMIKDRDFSLTAVRNPVLRPFPSVSISHQAPNAVKSSENWFNYFLLAVGLCVVLALIIGQATRSAAPKPYNPAPVSSETTSPLPATPALGPKKYPETSPSDFAAKVPIVEYIENSNPITINTLCNKGTGIFGGDECPFHGFYSDDKQKKWISESHYFTDEYDCKFLKAHTSHSRRGGTHSYPDTWTCYRTDGRLWAIKE